MVHNTQNYCGFPRIIRTIKSRRMRWAGHVARVGETRNAYRILVGKPEGKRPLGRRRWVDNIRKDPTEIGWDGVDWSHVTQYRDQWRALAYTAMNLRVSLNARKFLSSCTIGGFSRRSQLRE
jgi:hypothetical protein